jgi:hypothetical protein
MEIDSVDHIQYSKLSVTIVKIEVRLLGAGSAQIKTLQSDMKLNIEEIFISS